MQLDRKVRDLARCARLIATHRSFPPSQSHQKQGPFPPPVLPGFLGTSGPSRASPTDARLPFRRAVLTTPVDPMGARRLSLWRAPAPGSSPSVLPFPDTNEGRVDIG